MATLLLLPLAFSEDWNVLREVAYIWHKIETEEKMEELSFFTGDSSTSWSHSKKKASVTAQLLQAANL